MNRRHRFARRRAHARAVPAGWRVSLAVAAVLLLAPAWGVPCTLTTTGAASVKAGALFTLSLGATDTGDGLPTSWTINWGDGTIQSVAGNPVSVTHTYNGPEPSRFTRNILASAVCGGNTYFQNDLVVPSAATDQVNWYTHDAVTDLAVTRAPVQSGPDAGLSEPDQALVGPDGIVYVSGWTSANIVRYDAVTGAFIDEFVDGASLAPARTSMLGMAFGPDGHLYVAIPDGSEVLRFDRFTGAFIDAFVTAGLGGIVEPEGLTFGPDGNLYVSDFTNGAVYRYDGTTGAFIDIFVSAGSGGLEDPESLTFGRDGNLYVASDKDHNVLRFDGTTGAFLDEFVTAGSGGLDNAQGVAFGPDGHFYVSSWRDDSVYRYDGLAGTFIDVYVSGGLGGLNTAEYFDFIPGHQVMVVNEYTMYKTVTVQRSRIAGSCGATLTDYPMLFSVHDPDLAHTASGGDVTDAQGDDIVFKAFDDATCGGAGMAPCTLDHEIEKYVSTTGELVAWVRLPAVNTASAGSDSVIVVFYGNSSITTPTENPDSVWDSGFRGVWHLEEDVTDEAAAGTHDDSTSNSNDGAQDGNVEITGQIADGQDFDGVDDRIDIANPGIANAVTVSAWVKHDNLTGVIEDYIHLGNEVFIRHDGINSVAQLDFAVRGGGMSYHLRVNGALTNGTWYHVAGTWDGTTQRVFLDGAEMLTQTPAITLDAIGAGSGISQATETMDGAIDEARVSDTARSACWIGAEYENGNDPGDIGAPGFYIIGDAEVTAVELSSFTARGLDGAVELRWETGSELDNLGFHVYRSSSLSGPYEPVTTSLIPGLGSSPAGARYRYVDSGLTEGRTYYYELEDVDTTGATERHGPVWTEVLAASVDGSQASPQQSSDVSARLTYGNPEANAFRIVPRRNGVVVELETHGFEAVAQQDGSVRLEVPGLDEFLDASLPVKRAWLAAIAGKDVKLVSVRARELARFASLWPSGSLEPEVDATARGGVRARTRRGIRRQFAREGAKLLQVGYQGEKKKALLELAPFAWDRGGLVLATKLEVNVVFRGREVRKTRPGSKASVRLVTHEPGLYQVSLAELFGARRAASLRKIRLSRQGESVPFHMEAGTLYFWSEGAAANPYGTNAVYELELGVPGDPMELAEPAVEASTYYLETLEREENRYYQSALLQAPDLWLWEVLFAPSRKSFGFEVQELAVGAAPSSLSVWLQGTSDVIGVEDHHVRIHVNGALVGEGRWDGKRAHAIELELGPGVLREGDNELEVESVLDTGASYAVQMVDRFAVRYPRAVSALEGAAYVLDLTDRPRWVPAGAGFERERDYERFDEAHRPQMHAVPRAQLRRKRRRAEYLVIGPEELLNEARDLVRHRRRQSLRVATASTEVIASEFGYGELTPDAIREFISYAYHEWRRPRLRYVLLLGDATYDFKNYLGTDVTNQVPPMMVRTSYLWTASDPAYAAVNGDDLLPDVAIGRLPAKSPEQLRAMVAKIIAYETKELSDDAPFVLVADNADDAGDFENDADELASTLLAGRETKRIYLSRMETPSAREAIVESFDGGASTVSYLGHGAINLWADENVFNNRLVETLAPQAQQPILLTMNCLNGYFHFPYFDSLAETLVQQEDKGAIAAFSPSGLSLNGPAHRYHQAVLEELVSARHARLGDAVLAAQEDYADSGAFPELLSIYHLFGDPALTLRVGK